MKKSLLKKYAKLIACTGANVQKGQYTIVRAMPDQVELVGYVVEECYKAGASYVEVDWMNPANIAVPVTKYTSLDILGSVPNWKIEKLKMMCELKPAMIYIDSTAPDEFKKLDQRKSAQAKMKLYPIVKPYNDAMDNHYQWTIVGAASKKWAKEVFPDLPASKAVEALWEAILKTARVTDDPVQAWNDHNADLLNRCNYLNSLGIDYLHYKSEIGTDFKVWLSPEINFLGGGETTIEGVYYNPNMPTEECFTTPIKGKAEGKIVAALPLSYQGDIIDKFWFDFKDGKVADFGAERGYELLKQMLSMDENAKYLGECALVPFESPINESGVLFYSTLYDENAVCHFALGRGFEECVKNHAEHDKEYFNKIGINDSMIHVDFMIGTRNLEITAHTRDGKNVPIFKHGTWAF